MNSMSILKTELIEKREYQKTIAETAARKNTLVVLPTGMGKTLVSVLVGAERLEKFPYSKILITAPTRPLNAQHKKSFEKFTNVNPEKIVLITGKIKPKERVKLYQEAKIITATPQCIKNDLKNNLLNLEIFSFVTFDEAHRCIKGYAYTYIARRYVLQAKNPLILGLTASPGAVYERIDKINKNLFIKAVEIRTELDKDVKKYVKPIEREWVYVDLPEEFKKIKTLLEESLKEKLYWLKEHHYTRTYRPSKKELLFLQKKIGSRFIEGAKNYSLMWAMIKVVEAIKLEHALELLETQGIFPFFDYAKKLEISKKKTDKRLLKDSRLREALEITERLRGKIDHPKFEKLLYIVKNLVKENSGVKIIVFANYRFTVDKINGLLKNNGIKSEILIGQAIKEGKGLTQKQQIEIIKKFRAGKFNVLVTSSIGEEGLDIAATNYAIFFEPIPSEIRVIQRRGRVGRQTAGKVIFLITKGTRDEAYYWTAFRKEKKMKGILYDLKEKKRLDKKKSLLDWTK
jgi:Fanconi anemia group M protein